MTRNQAIKLLPIIQAYAEGKTVQVRGMKPETSWIDILDKDVSTILEANQIEWRVKPEPGEWWLVVGLRGDVLQVCDSREQAQNTQWAYSKIIHVREVLE